MRANLLKLRDFLAARSWPFRWRIVTIVNGSDDASGAIADSLTRDDSRFTADHLAQHGKGLALRHYFTQSQADILVFMDVDLAVSLDNIPALVAPLLDGSADLVIGSRLLPTSKTSRSWWRGMTSHFYHRFSRLVFRHPFRDLQCGFKAIRQTAFKAIEAFLDDGHWFFDTELVMLIRSAGYRIREIPVDWQENRYDKRASKVRVLFDSWDFIKNSWRLRARLKRFKRYRDNV